MEKSPNTQPILVKPKGENVFSGGSKIEVWQTDGKVKPNKDSHGMKRDGFHVTAYGNRSMQHVNFEGGPNKTQIQRQELLIDESNEQGQDQLARELAELPLRNDEVVAQGPDGKLIEGTIDDYYTVEGVKYAALNDGNGNRVGVYIDSLSPDAQAELREAKLKHDTVEKGEVALEAAEVKEPNPWSPEVAQERRDRTQPSSEAPRYYEDGFILPVSFSNGGSETFHGNNIGWFQKGGKYFNIIKPTAKSRERTGFTGSQMIVPREFVYTQTQEGARETREEIEGIAAEDDASLQRASEAAARVSGLDHVPAAGSAEQEPEPVKEVEKSPQERRQERYDMVKVEMIKITDSLDGNDPLYIDDYAKADLRPGGYNEQQSILPKMSDKLRANTDLILRYSALYAQKQTLLRE